MIIATGFFDGVHMGHRQVIGQLVEAARARKDRSMVVTFWPHPRTVLQKDARNLRLLTSLDEKKEMLASLGVDEVRVLDFTREFSGLSTEQYLRDYVIGRFGGKAILLGYDNRMGSNSGSTSQIADLASSLGLEVIRCGEVRDIASGEGVAISSTRIRDSLLLGKVEEASRMLGYDYSLLGVVVAGNHLGRTIGFPTANMQLYEPLKLIPERGVYLVRVETLGRELYGMCNIGFRPTVGPGSSLTIETNIFDFDEEIYGLDLRLSFMRRIRSEVKFASVGLLKEQLTIDRARCEELLRSLK
ncbi:MAG: riboflavin biosynthesis protein RibF [Bacteroidales bacterium]|nr:riboflavin biosynthesis protein RibF [Bacteroidales bacterium]